MVAAIAEQHLSDESRHAVGVLTEGRGLVDLANWADQIKSKPAWRHTKPWHYIEIGDQQRLETMVRDSRSDILRALNRSETHLRDASKDRRSRWQALACAGISGALYCRSAPTAARRQWHRSRRQPSLGDLVRRRRYAAKDQFTPRMGWFVDRVKIACRGIFAGFKSGDFRADQRLAVYANRRMGEVIQSFARPRLRVW